VARRSALVALAFLLVLAVAPAADAKKPKCKAYKEKKGCKLKGGVFATSYKSGSPGFWVSTGRTGAFSIGGDILCPGRTQTWWFHFNDQAGNQRLKVGKTSKLSGGSINTSVSGTVKVLSAKRARLKVTVAFSGCQVPYNATLKRRKKAPKLPRPFSEGYTPGQIFYV
jgi:hypothetical protein